MKLDDRIIEGKKPLDCFDAENEELIKPFLNKEGYVSNNLENFCLLDGCFKRLLSNVFKKVKDCFKTSINGGDGGDWKYFLPAEWVKEPKKKYRPYTLAEWIDQHEIGEVIHYRDKDYKQEFCVMYSGYIIDEGEDIQDVRTIGRIVFMFTAYFLEELFKDYEICINGEWKPFGVIEND